MGGIYRGVWKNRRLCDGVPVDAWKKENPGEGIFSEVWSQLGPWRRDSCVLVFLQWRVCM